MPIAPESVASALEAAPPSHAEVPLPEISSPPAVPMRAQPVFEPSNALDPSEAETVINLAVAPRPSEPEIVMPPKAVEPQPLPRATLPPVSMSLPADSGLELVETRSKATPMSEPEPAPEGPRRVRPPRPVVTEEPLQIIETRKENSPPA